MFTKKHHLSLALAVELTPAALGKESVGLFGIKSEKSYMVMQYIKQNRWD